MIISKEFRFEASHILPLHKGKYSRLHGHSWQGSVSVQGPIDKQTGFVMDFGDLKEIVQTRIVDVLDHRHLGAWWTGVDASWVDGPNSAWGVLSFPEDFYPSNENLVEWVVSQLKLELSNLYEVRLRETCTSEAIWRAPVINIRGEGLI